MRDREVINEHGIRIHRNHVGEVFISDVRTNVEMRINRSPDGGLQFTTYGHVEPIRVTNMIGWRVYREAR